MSIEKRGTSYLARVQVRGERRSKSHPTKREARAWIAKQKQRPGGSETVREFSVRWLEGMQFKNDGSPKKAVTVLTHSYMLRPFLDRYGSMKLREMEDVPYSEAQRFASEHPSTTKTAKAMLTSAMRDGLIVGHGFLMVHVPQKKRPPLELTTEGLYDLADLSLQAHGPEYGPKFRAHILFAAFTGLRSGEQIALEWDDLDLRGLTISVRRSYETTTKELSTPKGDKTKLLFLPPQARDAIQSMPRTLDKPQVFLSKRGHPLTRNSLYPIWNVVRAKAGLERIRFHDLRHFAATHMRELGLSREDVAYQLGHSKLQTTELYDHADRSAIDRIRAAFSENVIPLTKVNEANEESA